MRIKKVGGLNPYLRREEDVREPPIGLWNTLKYLGPGFILVASIVGSSELIITTTLGATVEKQIEGCIEAKERGFTALGHLNPFLDEPADKPYFKTHADKISDAVDNVRRYREAVGNGVDLCIEIHRRLTPAEAVVLARGIEPYNPYFFEDPIVPDNFDAMGEIARQISIPIATGERLHTIYEFQMLLARGAAQYVRPSVCLCGGLTGAKKIAALAEAHHVGVVPHNPLSPVCLTASLQLDACIPNFALQEYPTSEYIWENGGNTELIGHDIVASTPTIIDGFIAIPDAPGLGIELTTDAREKFPPKPRSIQPRLHKDGSVVDQ